MDSIQQDQSYQNQSMEYDLDDNNDSQFHLDSTDYNNSQMNYDKDSFDLGDNNNNQNQQLNNNQFSNNNIQNQQIQQQSNSQDLLSQDLNSEQSQQQYQAPQQIQKQIQKDKRKPNVGESLDHDTFNCPECKQKQIPENQQKKCSIYKELLKKRKQINAQKQREDNSSHLDETFQYLTSIELKVVKPYQNIIQNQNEIIQKLFFEIQNNYNTIPAEIQNQYQEIQQQYNNISYNFQEKRDQYIGDTKNYIRGKRGQSPIKKYLSLVMIFATILCFTSIGGFTDISDQQLVSTSNQNDNSGLKDIEIDRQSINMDIHSQNIQQMVQANLKNNLVNFSGGQFNRSFGMDLDKNIPSLNSQRHKSINKEHLNDNIQTEGQNTTDGKNIPQQQINVEEKLFDKQAYDLGLNIQPQQENGGIFESLNDNDIENKDESIQDGEINQILNQLKTGTL